MSAFRSVSPLLAVTFVNKIASLAMAVLPAMIVARGMPAGEAATVMIVGKGAAVFGTLLSGPLSDRVGPKPVLVGSIAIGGLGAWGMALAPTSAALALAAAVCSAGLACFPVVNRMLIAGSVPLGDQREALAWLRTTANLGLVASFTLGGFLGSHVVALVVVDGAMSLVAAALGAVLLPDVRPPPAGLRGGASTWGPFGYMTLVICGWGFAYEGFLTACAARLALSLGAGGVSVFSWVMVLNTVFCALLGVLAASRIARPDRTIAGGFALLLVGAALGVTGHPAAAFAGMGLVTLGELLFSATGQFVWMSLTPDVPRKATVFSTAMTMSFLARAAGSALVFPLVVDGAQPALAMAALVVPGLALALLAGPVWAAFREVGGVR